MSESLFMSQEKQRELSQKKIDKKKKEVGSWIPGGHDLRVNLDALQADRRQKQIAAVFESAENADEYTKALPLEDRKQTEFILRSNVVRVMEQLGSVDHTVGAIDRFVKKLFAKKTENKPHERMKLDVTDTSVRRDVAKFFREDKHAPELYGMDGLGSDFVNDGDKEMLLRNIQELFKAITTSAEDDATRESSARVRKQIVQAIAKVLPELPPELQELAMEQMADLQFHYAGRSDFEPSVDRYSQAMFLDAFTPESFALLDEEAKIRFLKNVKLDVYTALRLSSLLIKEKSRAVYEAMFVAIAKADPNAAPADKVTVNYNIYTADWKNVPDAEKRKLYDFYTSQTVENALNLPISPNGAYDALKSLDGFMEKAGKRLPDVIRDASDVYKDFTSVENSVDPNIFLAAPGYYLEKHRKAKIPSEKKQIKDDFIDVTHYTWLRITKLLPNSSNQSSEQIEVLVSALESARRVFKELAPTDRFTQKIGSWDTSKNINMLRTRSGKKGDKLATRLEKVFSN